MNYEPSRPDKLILSDHLALERTRLANERTLLAYIRTAFMFLIAGASALKLFADRPAVVVTAWVFITMGTLAGVFGVWRFGLLRRRINGRVDDSLPTD